MKPRIESGNDLAAVTPSCGGEERYQYRAGTLQSESFHVVQTKQELQLTLFLRALLIPNEPENEDSYVSIFDYACLQALLH